MVQFDLVFTKGRPEGSDILEIVLVDIIRGIAGPRAIDDDVIKDPVDLRIVHSHTVSDNTITVTLTVIGDDQSKDVLERYLSEALCDLCRNICHTG